jgi:DNA-directed RNA polymerase subunit beta
MEDGKYVDICISPLSVISRMNLGQIFELHLGMSLVDLKRQLVNMLTEGKSQEELKKYILDYIKIIDNTEGNWYYKQFEEQLNITTVDETFIYKLSVVEPPFESSSAEMILKALEYTNTPSEYKMFDSISNRWVLNPIAVGYMYFFKMIHIAETKLAGRGIGVYNKRTLQPLGGRKNRGGQRCGEMETACLIAHGSTYNLHEFLTTKSDCTDLKNDYIRSVVESEFIRKPETLDKVPESVKLFDKYLQVIGLDSKD